MPNDREIVYDFADITRAYSEKGKTFRKDMMNQASFGPIGVLTDPDSLDDDVEPGSGLWGLKIMPQSEQYFNSDSQKTLKFRKTWSQTQMSRYDTGQIV